MLHCCKVVGVNYDSIMDVQLITFVMYYLSREVIFIIRCIGIRVQQFTIKTVIEIRRSVKYTYFTNKKGRELKEVIE